MENNDYALGQSNHNGICFTTPLHDNCSKTKNPLPKSKNLVLGLSPGASEKCRFLNQACGGINNRPNRLIQQETWFENRNFSDADGD